jgi:hypothetical protein
LCWAQNNGELEDDTSREGRKIWDEGLDWGEQIEIKIMISTMIRKSAGRGFFGKGKFSAFVDDNAFPRIFLA